LRMIGELVEKARNPIIMTADDMSNKKLATLKKKCAALQLRRPLPASIVKRLQEICGLEGVACGKDVLERVAKSSGGDVRAAVNDLETLATGRASVSDSDAAQVVSVRDRSSDIYRALSVIFGGRQIRQVVESTWEVDEELRDVIWWVEENTPRLYPDRAAIGEAYGNLSRADIYLGRIMRRQYWGFQRYANVLMTAGVNVSRPAKINFTQYQFPGYFAALGRTKSNRAFEKSISAKMGPRLHVSSKVFVREYIPLYRTLLSGKKMSEEELREEYKLEDDEIDYLAG